MQINVYKYDYEIKLVFTMIYNIGSSATGWLKMIN